MASVSKFTRGAVINQLRHNERAIANPSNADINPAQRNDNYSLIDRDSSYDYFKERTSNLYCYNRADVKVLAGWIITAPKDLPIEREVDFFKASHEFLCERYGENNCVQSIVHKDESGQPHLHFMFIPVVPDSKHGGEKICANDVLNPKDLQHFHEDLQACIERAGIHASVHTGITRDQGGNRTVKELKAERDLDRNGSRWVTTERTEERSRWD